MLNSLDLPGPPEATRVVAAMSGGVDSSVVAALLKQQGYDVIGITLQLYDHGAAAHRKGACCAGQDIKDARAVAAKLGIPHYVLDYEEKFRHAVIDKFAESYIAGETPIPCVACNQSVKFTDLIETARTLGADVLATGHYVKSRQQGAHRALYTPRDETRDQSYFLFATTPEQLDFLRFPLGDLTKTEVRKIAQDLDLAVAGKEDSQDICFVPEGRYAAMIARLRPDAAEAGEIVHVDGRVLGRHEGIIHYTIGQRRGLKIAAGEPLFVVALDAEARRVIVGPREALRRRRLLLRDLNWLGDESLDALPEEGLSVYARVRSSRKPRPALFSITGEGPAVDLLEGEDGVAPGQACVLYDHPEGEARVLGGGFIARGASPAETARPAFASTPRSLSLTP